jgi:hypothetical protein
MVHFHPRLSRCATAQSGAWLHGYNLRDRGTSAFDMARTSKRGAGARAQTGRSERPAQQAPGQGAIGRKLIAFDPEILQALILLARDRMQSFQELADEAFADLLRKHGRPVTLQQALRKSVDAAGSPKRRRSD